jgi:hypothetical protein
MTAEQKFPCPRCGSPQAMSAIYCSNCSLSLGAAVLPPGPVPTTPKPPGGSRRRTAVLVTTWILLGLVVLAVIGSLSKPPMTSSPGLAAGGSSAPTVGPVQSATATPAVRGSYAPATPASAEPIPSDEPVPTAAPPLGVFAPIKLAGSGNKVPKFTIPDDGAAIAKIASSGTKNFVVWSLASDGLNNDLLVNTSGRYAGTVLFDDNPGEHSVAFEIEAKGNWTITISPIESARAWDGASRLSGRGDDVVQVVPPVSGLTVAKIVNKGSGNIVVETYTAVLRRDLIVNGIGNYSGDVQLAVRTTLIQVESDGTWSITPQ